MRGASGKSSAARAPADPSRPEKSPSRTNLSAPSVELPASSAQPPEYSTLIFVCFTFKVAHAYLLLSMLTLTESTAPFPSTRPGSSVPGTLAIPAGVGPTSTSSIQKSSVSRRHERASARSSASRGQ